MSVICATMAEAEAPASLPGCASVGAVLSAAELLEIVPGHRHRSPAEDDRTFRETFSLLESPVTEGVYVHSVSGDIEEMTSGYRIGEDGLCTFEPSDRSWVCRRIARCASGEADFVGWFDGDDTGWTYSAIVAYPPAKVAVFSEDMATLPPPSVTPRPDYDTSHIAPALEWATAETDLFRGFPGLVGIYVAEGAGDGPLIRDYVMAQNYSTGERIGDGRRLVSTLLRIEGGGLEVPPLFHWAGESGTSDLLFGPAAHEGDRLDLAAARPGVVDIVTNAEGVAGRGHWGTLRVELFTTLARWDPATHGSEGHLRVISPSGDLFSRSILVCDAAERAAGAPQVTLMGGETCRRYDRAFEVTGMLRDKNGLQVAAAIGAQEAPLVMQVGQIAVAGDAIRIGAALVPPFVLLDTGRFQGWDDWMDRTRGTGGRERPVTCTFPLAAAGALGEAKAGDLLRFRASLVAASDAGVELACGLD